MPEETLQPYTRPEDDASGFEPVTTRDSIPIVVDLDGTMIRTDLLWESTLRLITRMPWMLFVMPLWLLRGRHALKAEIAKRVKLDPTLLPYNEEVLAFLRKEHDGGRRLVLATGTNRLLAEPVAEHLGLFDEVIASDDQTNLCGQAKAECLVKRFGRLGFDYAGDSVADLPVWHAARRAFVIGKRPTPIADTVTLSSPENHWWHVVRLLRPHHWLKNLILFVPLLTAHKFGVEAVAETAAGFAAFSLCASGLYALNDLLDLDADRHHIGKRNRPLAAGDLSLPLGAALSPILIGGGLGIALALPSRFLLVLLGYAFLTAAYSLGLKRIALVDVFSLAGLYTIRLIGGHEATGVAYSSWLLMFSMFIFLSLALAKRFQELHALRQRNHSDARGRGYTVSDLELVGWMGSSSGFMAILVLGIYVTSEQVQTLYTHPTRLLLVCPLMMYWVSRLWLVAHRGELLDDPVVFALRDRVSYLVGGLILILIWLAT